MEKLLFSFEGRIGRQTYILSSLAVTFIIGVLAGLIAPVVSGGENGGGALLFILLLPLLILSVWIGLALAVKRFHDQEKSGWWVLLCIIPYVGGIIVWAMTWFIKGTDGPNVYGEDPLK